MKLIFMLLAAAAIALAGVTGAAGVLSEDLAAALARADEGDFIRIYIKPDSGPDLTILRADASGLPKPDRRALVVAGLKEAAARNHAQILSVLREEEALGGARGIRSLWLSNVIGVHARKSTVLMLQGIPSVNRLELVTSENALIGGNFREQGSLPETSPLMPDTVWNIGLVDAPCAWQEGYTGQGIVVGHFDTGVNYNHVDLADHVWVNLSEIPGNLLDDDTNGYVDDYYGYDFANTDSDPMDDHGHGTHTAGTVAGDGTAGRNTGVAPDAQIMSLKVLDQFGSGAEFDVWEAIQYAVDMGADVLTFSIGWLYYYDPDRATWRTSFDAVEATGICAAVAAGNEGQYWLFPWWYPPPENLRTPGDVPPPWLHPDQTLIGGLSGVVSVGATDSSDVLASFSSIGPVSWDSIAPYLDYAYNPGMGLVDPDVSAPGVEVTSLRYSINNGYVGGPSWSGTSMACPHVAGLMALMLSKNPTLTPAQVDSIIEVTALELGALGKDNEFGSGRIRVCEAIFAVQPGVQEERPGFSPSNVASLSIMPNPFTSQVGVSVFLGAESTSVRSVSFYDTGGRLVSEIELSAVSLEGRSMLTLAWDGRDTFGRPLAGGTYFVRVETEQGVLADKVVLLR